MLQLVDRWNLRRVFMALWCLGWVVVIAASLEPNPSLPGDLSDKSCHFLAYAGMTLGTALFCRSARQLLFLATGAVLVGIMLEFGQTLVPSRSFEVADMIANSAGVVAGSVVVATMLYFFTPRRERASARI
ncbi:MAG: VanZ family protein [Geminicoccaceae bacterium]